jgi:hypothetical protein
MKSSSDLKDLLPVANDDLLPITILLSLSVSANCFGKVVF